VGENGVINSGVYLARMTLSPNPEALELLKKTGAYSAVVFNV
jgi:hypothetical protein